MVLEFNMEMTMYPLFDTEFYINYMLGYGTFSEVTSACQYIDVL